MDLNQLLFHHQVALINLTNSSDSRSVPEEVVATKATRFDLVRHYEKRIARLRSDLGVPGYPVFA